MRNYINLLLQSINVHFDDGGGGSGDYTVRIVGSSAADLAEQGRIQEQIQRDFNPTFTFTFTYDAIVTTFWLLEITYLLAFARWNVLPDIFYILATGNIPAAPKITVLESPRYSGWTDNSGTKRKPPPSDQKKGAGGDFSGASGLFAAAQALLAYSEALKSQGDLRGAGIVKFAYDRIFDLTWTVTQAFDYLRKQRLL